jgi:2,4-dienoyl-CoA reductase-like NADH-dependent reductase (Old Yellow Enzyme family)
VTPHLFAPLTLLGLTLRNRIVVSPMCQYSCVDGVLSDWHLVHLGSRAVGGAGLVFVEATAVEARGRISPDDSGLWQESQIEPIARIARFVRGQGAALGVQLAHAGRKASCRKPWAGGGPLAADDGGWPVVGPSPLAFAPGFQVPHELSREEIAGIVGAFRAAARRAIDAGVDVVEVHGAHGYLAHSFLSPISNHREDEYGGSLENRARFIREVTRAVRDVWPADRPLFVRVSASDWVEGGFQVEDAVQVARWLRDEGAQAIDVSSGGSSPAQKIPLAPGYQVPFAEKIRREAQVPTVAVGLLTDPRAADAIVREGRADLVALAREMLRDPYWAQRAAKVLGTAVAVPPQYLRAHG